MLDLRAPFLPPPLSCHLQFVQHRLQYGQQAVVSPRAQNCERGVPGLSRQFGRIRKAQHDCDASDDDERERIYGLACEYRDDGPAEYYVDQFAHAGEL